MKRVISISLFEEAGGISGGIVTIMVASFFGGLISIKSILQVYIHNIYEKE